MRVCIVLARLLQTKRREEEMDKPWGLTRLLGRRWRAVETKGCPYLSPKTLMVRSSSKSPHLADANRSVETASLTPSETYLCLQNLTGAASGKGTWDSHQGRDHEPDEEHGLVHQCGVTGLYRAVSVKKLRVSCSWEALDDVELLQQSLTLWSLSPSEQKTKHCYLFYVHMCISQAP